MTAEADRSWQEAEATRLKERLRRGLTASYVRVRKGARWLWQRLPFRHGFSSLTRRIVILNLIGLAILVSGILYLNQFRAGLIDAKVQSLLTQGEIIAGALAASAGVDTDQIQLDPEKLLESEAGQSGNADDDALASSLEFTIDPERAAPILRRLVKPTGSRARIYGRDGALILDSDTFYSRGEVLRYDLPPPDAEPPDALTSFWQAMKTRMRQYDLPLYNEIGGDNGKAYPEVASALTGTSVPIVRVNEKGELGGLRGGAGAAHARRARRAAALHPRRRHRQYRGGRALGHRPRVAVRGGGDRRLVDDPRQYHRGPGAAARLGGRARAP